jgi:transcriptional regulator with XRE-family HTH domain
MTNKSKTPRASGPLDKSLGLRIRQARNEAKLSQDELGLALGVTFQQVQKYEKGVNRVSGVRLVQMCRTLNKPMEFFLDAPKLKPDSRGEKVAEFIASREGQQICEFMSVMKPELRGEIIGMARTLSRIGAQA